MGAVAMALVYQTQQRVGSGHHAERCTQHSQGREEALSVRDTQVGPLGKEPSPQLQVEPGARDSCGAGRGGGGKHLCSRVDLRK